MYRKSTLPIAFVSLALACGCGYSPPPADPTSLAEYRQIDPDRHAFLDGAGARIHALESELGHLTMEAQFGGKSVDPAERAKWTQTLLDRMQEKSRLQAELARARVAHLYEWEKMRGDFATAVDRLDAEVTELGDELMDTLSRDEAARRLHALQESVRVDTGLCPMVVKDAQADVAIDEKDGAVVLVVTLDRKGGVAELRRKALALTYKSAYTPGVLQLATAETAAPIAARILAQPVYAGVRLTVKPNDKAQLAALQQAIARDAVVIENRRCATVGATETG